MSGREFSLASTAPIARDRPPWYGRDMGSPGLENLFIECRPALARFLRARCGGDLDVEDLLQDLWLKLDGIVVDPADAQAYFYRMADNLVTDRRRSAQRRVRRDDAWTAHAFGEGEASPAPSPEREAIARSELRRVAALFDQLGERTTAIFRSYRIEGEKQDDIAAAHGISRSAVEKHLQKAYRAVLQLRDKLDAEIGEADRLTGEGAKERL